jgi:hypothetical protein
MVILSGCNCIDINSERYKTPDDNITNNEIYNNGLKNSERYMTLDDNIANNEIYENGLKLSDAMGYINCRREMLKQADNIELLDTGGKNDEFYEGYRNNEVGLYFVCYKTGGVKYIELDSDKFSLQGINKYSSFEDVKRVFGDNLVNVVEDALPGLRRYELVYKFNNNFFKVYAFDEKGNSNLYFCVTDEFESKYGYMEITPDDINDYFEMTKESIMDKLGRGDETFSNQLRYNNYGVTFEFNTEDTKPYQIYFSSIYQFNDLRQNMTVEKTIDLMGEGIRIETNTEEDGPLTIQKYEYKRFNFNVCYLMEDGTSWWQIIRK